MVSPTLESSSPALLPAFVPFPFTSTEVSDSSNPTSPTLAEASPRMATPNTKFFSRSRSNSLHTSNPSLASTPKLETPPLHQRFSQRQDVEIKSCSVPYHTKVGGRWHYACRVVPDTDGENGLERMALAISRKNSLGRMAVPGTGEFGEREPYTVFRGWSEFVALSADIQAAFPVVPLSASPVASTSKGSPLSHQTPKLSRKLTLFVTRHTITQRQEDLDFFVRRLFELRTVCNSEIVKEFFTMRPADVQQCTPSLELAPTSPLSENGAESFAQFLSTRSPQATIRSPPTGKRLRPRLNLKYSTPNLRKEYESDDVALHSPALDPTRSFGRGTIRPGMASRATALGVYAPRDSQCSTSASSVSSSFTITPSSPASSLPTLESIKGSPVLSSGFDSTPPVNRIKRPQGPLRHFRSLQDLRINFSSSSLPTPPLPVSSEMDRARTQPHLSHSVPQYALNRMASGGPTSAPAIYRTRSGSKSSIHSLEEVTNASPSTNSIESNFRTGAFGRLHGIPETHMQRNRRPSMPTRTCSVVTKASCGHSPSSSFDSLRSSGDRNSSLDMSRTFSGNQSGRSSTDFSDTGSTPPTPSAELRDSGKYYANEHNNVPLPPFFPVPPSMTSSGMSTSYSHDSHDSSHRRLADGRSRNNSSASARPALDTIQGSPKLGSTLSVHQRRSPTPAPALPDAATITIKILHTETIALRVSRTASLDGLKSQVLAKFSSGAVQLDGTSLEFALVGGTGEAISSNEFGELVGNLGLEKASLRII